MIKEIVTTLCDKCGQPIRGEFDIVTTTMKQSRGDFLEWHICDPCGQDMLEDLIRVLGSPGQVAATYRHSMFKRPSTTDNI